MKVSAFRKCDSENNNEYFEEIEWVEHADHYLSKHTKQGKQTFSTLREAQAFCLLLSIDECAGVTQTEIGFQPRQGSDGKRPSKSGEISFLRGKVEDKSEFSVFKSFQLDYSEIFQAFKPEYKQ